MDEGRSNGPDAVEGGARDPQEIRADIEATRQELGETAAALADKADVKGRAHARVEEVKEQARSKAGEVKERVTGAAPDSASQAAGQAREVAGQAQAQAREHPEYAMAAGALVAGFLLGWMVGRR